MEGLEAGEEFVLDVGEIGAGKGFGAEAGQQGVTEVDLWGGGGGLGLLDVWC